MAIKDAVIVLVALAVPIWRLVEQVASWISSKKKGAEGFTNASHWHPRISSALLMVALSLAVNTGGLAADSKSGSPSAPQTQKSGVPKSPGLNAPSAVGTPTPLLPSATPQISPSPLPDRVPLLPPPGSAPASPDVRMDGLLPRYSDGTGGWSTKNIKEDINRSLAILDDIVKIGTDGSAEANPNSLDPETRASLHGRWTRTAEDVPSLKLIQGSILSMLRQVPEDVLRRALEERDREQLKVTPWPPAPGDPPGTFIKVEPLPNPYIHQPAKPRPRPGIAEGGPVPIVPAGPDSPIEPTVDPGWLGPNWGYEWVGEGNSSSFFVGPIGGRVIQGPSSPWGSGPEAAPGAPGQRGVVATPGGPSGGSSIAPQPGQGGTLLGLGGPSGGTSGGSLPLVPGGASQKGGLSGLSGGTGGELVGVRGGGGGEPGGGGTPQKGKGDGGIKAPLPAGDKGGSTPSAEQSGSVPPNPYDSVPENPYGSDDSNEGSSSSSGGSSERTTSGRGGKRANEDDPHEHQQAIEMTLDNPLPPELNPHGRSGGGNDLGGFRKLPARPPGVTQQDVDLVGPAFQKVTGPDDKERPATGGVSGTVSQNPAESRTDDVGGLHRPRLGGGGDAGSAFETLLKQLGLWDKWQAGGPDPAAR